MMTPDKHERKHTTIKQLLVQSKNFKNVSYSLAVRHQERQVFEETEETPRVLKNFQICYAVLNSESFFEPVKYCGKDNCLVQGHIWNVSSMVKPTVYQGHRSSQLFTMDSSGLSFIKSFIFKFNNKYFINYCFKK